MKKITPFHYSKAYEVGRRFLAGLPHADAVAELESAGMNRTSASFSIGNLRQMVNGAAYRRAMSLGQTRYFLTQIHVSDGMDGLKKAVAAFRAHLPYLRTSNGNRMPGLTQLLVEFEEYIAAQNTNPQPASPSDQDALHDLAEKPEGNDNPDRADAVVSRFKRDAVIRAYVLKRARGKCEYCDELGFLMPNGLRYIEAHHIIALAADGKDTIENVIGLCAGHHREAHFGGNAQKLEQAFIEKLRAPVGPRG